MEAILETIRQILNGLHIPPRLHPVALLSLSNIVSIAIGFLLGRNAGRDAKAAGADTVTKKRPPEESWIDELHREIKALREQNQQHRYFIVSLPRIIRHLNTTSDLSELSQAIVRLAAEAFQTDTAHLYAWRKEENALRKMYAIGRKADEIEGFEMGEGIVGRAAGEKAIVKAGEDEEGNPKDVSEEDETGLAMAGPIVFEGSLVGVLAVGRSNYPSGDESSMLKMLSDVAGVSLYNRAFLGEAGKKASTDSLTGLYNRRHFFEVSREYVKRSATHGGPISFFLFDIDNFKNYNDQNGHHEGDRLLKELSELVLKDSRESNVVARYGGEEFIIMLKNVSKENAVTYAGRLCEKISSHPFDHREKQPLGMVSISGGVSTYPVDGESVKEVIGHADAALYRAKARGRNRVEVHSATPLYEEEDEEGLTFPA